MTPFLKSTIVVIQICNKVVWISMGGDNFYPFSSFDLKSGNEWNSRDIDKISTGYLSLRIEP